MAGFNLSQQVQVGGVAPQRVSNLADDLNGLFGAVGQASQKYAQIGEQAAKLQASEDARNYQEQVSTLTSALTHAKDNPEVFFGVKSRIDELSNEFMSKRDTFKNNQNSFDAYSNYAADVVSSTKMQFEPMYQQGFIAASLNQKAKDIEHKANIAGILPTKELLDLSVSQGKIYGETLNVSERQVSLPNINAMDNSIKGKNPLELLKDVSENNAFDIKKTVKYLNTMVGSLVEYVADKDGNVGLNTKIESQDIREMYMDRYKSLHAFATSAFPKENKQEKNVYAEQIFNTTEDTLSRVKNGSMTLIQVKEAYINNNKTIDELLDETKTTLTDTQRTSFISGQVKSDIAFETIIKANSIVEKAMGEKQAINDLATSGGKFFVTVKDRTGKNEAKTVEVAVSQEQVKNILQTQISEVEKIAINQNGEVNADVVKSIITAIQATDGSAKSSLLASTKDTVFNVAVPPIINSKNDLLSAIEVQRNALKYGMTPENMMSVYDAQAYLDNLEPMAKAIIDNPSDKNNLSNMSKAFADAKEAAMQKPKRTANVNSFVVANKNEVIKFSSGEKLGDFNKILGHGASMPISEENHATFIKMYKQKYPNDSVIDETKYKDMVKDDAHYIGGALFFGDKKVILPPLFSSGGRKVSNYQIMGALTPSMTAIGIDNLEDLEKAKVSVYVDADKYGKNYLVLKYYDTSGKIYKTKSWSGTEISKLQYKEKAWYDSFIPTGKSSAEIARYKKQTKGK